MADRPQSLAERPPTVIQHRGVEVRAWGLYTNWLIVWPGNILDGMTFADDKARILIDWQLDDPQGPQPMPWMRIIPVAERAKVVQQPPALQETQPTAAVTTPQPLLAEVLEQKPVLAPTTPPPKAKKPSRKDLDRAAKMTRDENGKLVF